MSDKTALSRRGFLGGLGAVAAVAMTPDFAQAQNRSGDQVRYWVMTDNNHTAFNIRYLNDKNALQKMARAGYRDIFLEVPKDFQQIKNKSQDIFAWHVAGYFEGMGNIRRDKFEAKRDYLLGMRAQLNALERTARNAGIRVHYVDPMPTNEQVRLVMTASSREFKRQRAAVDPVMASRIRSIADKGIVFVGVLHGDNMKRLLPNAQTQPLHRFSAIANQAGVTTSALSNPALTPG